MLLRQLQLFCFTITNGVTVKTLKTLTSATNETRSYTNETTNDYIQLLIGQFQIFLSIGLIGLSVLIFRTFV